MKFVPYEVPLADLTLETVGQLLPEKAFLKNFLVLFELGVEQNKICPRNAANIAVLVCRKKLQLPCLRLLRVTAEF